MDTAERSTAVEAATFDGFISYSHAADGLLAPRLQSALQRFAKPWWKRRALRVFRDESSLSANPHLWSSITAALDQSGWFVLLLSPDAAQSEWVNQEIEYWTTHNDPTRLLPVVTDGEFGWNGTDVTGNSVPDALRGVFTEEPRWVDLRFARDEDQLDLKNPRFSAAVADIASALRGVPKDELESEEVKQHRRTIRTAWAGVALVGVLGVAAAGFAIQSASNAREAEAQRIAAEIEADRANTEAERADANADAEARARVEAESNAALAVAREHAASAIAVLEEDPELATLLVLAAIDATPLGQQQPFEVINALWRAGSSNRLVDVFETPHSSTLALAPEGELLAVTTAWNEVQVINPSTGAVGWSYQEDTVDFFTFTSFSSDGRLALSVIDSTAHAAPEFRTEEDELANRLFVFDTSTGETLHRLDFPDCRGVEMPSWSTDSAYLAIGSGLEGCVRDGS
ncbi:MAG TPA: TIR domain-containing protein, partial [Acidimicrobiia bacterium]|nr:TIR domain-containing protein [Acidimicrobiia bacterium]